MELAGGLTASLVHRNNNIDEWPNADLSPLPGKPGVFGYGFIPPGLFAQIKTRLLELARQNKSSAVRR
jgi:hypothetical protein